MEVKKIKTCQIFQKTKTGMCALSGGKKIFIFWKLWRAFYFLVTSVLRFALLPYYRAVKVSGNNKHWFNKKHLDNDTMKSVNFETIPSWKHLNEKVL